ncbi:MAG: four helix bundle protein [Armatimonadetes bacterium]|nr:four helix bundle protein [Armatimonadota bacterium]
MAHFGRVEDIEAWKETHIAEGYARETNIEFARFLVIARGSASEVKTQLYIALDIGYIEREKFDELYARIDKICRMLTGLMDYLKRNATGKPPTANRKP